MKWLFNYFFKKISSLRRCSVTGKHLCWSLYLIRLQALSLQVFLKKETPTQVLLCEVCETSKNIYFEEHLQNDFFWWYSIKNLFLKTYICNIHRTKVAGDKCSVKKMFLVVNRTVKVTCFYIDQHLL